MIDTLTRYINGSFRAWKLRMALDALLRPVFDRYSSQPLATAGLLISATTTLAKIGATAFHATVKGKLVTVAAGVDMPALVGTVTNAKFNVFCFFIDSASTVTAAMGTEAATRLGVIFPAFPEGKTLVGFVVINPTGTGNFVGGTTALGDATVVPNAQYVSPIGPFDPTVLI